jgi:uncharacterized membrane protein YgdD (TMEM256/DUF423 family)
MLTPRLVAALGSTLAAVAVAAGAFGAHGLKGRLGEADLAIFETAVRYHLIHAVALLAVAWAMDRWPGGGGPIAATLILAGVLIFSGSLYFLVLTGPRWLGAVTPLGGLCLIGGWLILAWHLATHAGP